MTSAETVAPRSQAFCQRRVVVVGQGFVGLPASMLAVQAGHNVVGYDTNVRRVTRLESGDSYISDVSSDHLREALTSGRFTPTNDPAMLEDFDVALIAVPTPLVGDQPDLSYIEAAAACLAGYIRSGCLVILESTTCPGTTENVVAPILETSGLKAGQDFSLGYAPERLNPGISFVELVKVPKVVSGVDASSTMAVTEFWSELVASVVAARNVRTAEVEKLVENAFRLVNISFVNELARLARSLDVSIWDVLDLAATKPYGYMSFLPSAGAGGHCLPSDTTYLAWSLRTAAQPSTLIDTAIDINRSQPVYVAGRVVAGMLRRNHTTTHHHTPHVVIVGATYKPDIADSRDSAALKVAHNLRQQGVDVAVVDPMLVDTADVLPELTVELVTRATAVVLLVAHEGLDYDLISSARYVFDACGALPPANNIERL
ncbi:nucleotide sugar dehydrogenase [Nocardia sp. CDC160]|uniref:nucleotide sugar dehydrogenase n=1 Tax=Nocardia sp. CDC160 TaxID=3112166 RepID=UPI002DBEF336|nr:nucleotide sugar dehydrogenase [Nocardia sp. CDC160]MEC3915528.1 nucleotide sugar dehydrogenase [Nocardia sp. CDC160]